MSKQMRVLCTGPESSGTRLLTRLVSNLGVEAIHRSIPHGKEWWAIKPEDYDRAIFICRDPFMTEISATEAGHPQHWEGRLSRYPDRLINAWSAFTIHIVWSGKQWLPLTYEGLLDRPQFVMDGVAQWLGVEAKPLAEEVKDPRV